ncbi:DUF4760 domain-containing protein [Oryzicola mucosus]|uniref:Uncharacterized protein n=1 Tax=Oryzicola mucosus TaxID=2767425 RepID=A0A8J6PGL5_9HYPH|nr:hypothetical protein [Oryzicola mucosus]MBD0413598.1 hypothetical protein [Oryzicola mucosus]
MSDAAPLTPPVAGIAPKPKTVLPETGEGLPWQSPQEIKKESNPFTDRDWRMLVYAWSGLALRLVLIFGAAFTVYQFLNGRDEKRVERTLDLVTLWEQPDYQQAQKAVRQRLDALDAANRQFLPAGATPAEQLVYFQRIGSQAMTEQGGAMPLTDFRDQFDRIVYFLNRVSTCVSGDLCSKEVADTYFKDYAQSFWNSFSGFIKAERRNGAPNFARAIESYAQGT